MKVEPIDNLYLALIQCFAIILCGYIAGRFDVITKIEANGLNTFVGTFALPSLIFMSLAKLNFTLVNWKFLFAVLLAKSCVFFVVLSISLIIKRTSNPGCAALFAIFTTQSNDFAIGYPMIHALYGKTHPEYAAYLYLMAPISLVILNPIGFVLLEIGIMLNPVLLMTVLGIFGNLVFSHVVPAVLATVLNVFGNAFSASALFLLGLMMVGKVHKLKGTALVIPENATDTQDLSTYGFLYGTIPTAPALFIFTLRYNLEIDLIASAMVACTFLSAPLMFVSAKLIDAVASGISPENYEHQLNIFSFDVSIASATVCIWLIICFIGLEKKKYKCITHKCTFCIIIAQLATAIGVVIWTKLESHNSDSILWYIQFILITMGVYASRIWTMAIAATLLYLSSRSLDFVYNIQKWFYPIGWGIPFLIAIIMCSTISSKESELEFRNPNFQFGTIQAGISIFILTFCFIVTIGCLILQQNYHRRNILTSYSNLINNTENSNNDDSEGQIVDVEDLISSTSNTPIIGCEYIDDCPNRICRGYSNEINNCDLYIDVENERNDPQLLRHLIFVILLLCSMFIGLSISIGTLLMEQLTGIYAELAFLDVALNFGQSLITFAIFGLDTDLGKLGYWLRKICRKWRTEKELQLPPEDALSPEVKAIRDQFNRCYLTECRARIAICHRRLLKVYKGVFTGTDLVNWLLEANIAQTREEAIQYGRNLLESRVLQHINGTHHFCDQNLLYIFNV
ncbi:Integral membrane protein [Apis cerana cerana]|uniref:Integral membrane protein n=1 Tax=Apis cerana cerana TaxID=94128 RepID=A0A2A3EMB3_APICC|nr:Integral membrane protein [Apis cerana cerana]